MSTPSSGPLPGFDRWLGDVESRHLCDMTTTEVARALRALSSTYVERRARLSGRGAFDTAGKRAAYALYYAPRRFLTVFHVVSQLESTHEPGAIVDVGCGTGAAGIAWAQALDHGSTIAGLDTHPWALDEARLAYRAFGVNGQVRRGAVSGAVLAATLRDLAPGRVGRRRAVVLSYVVNELHDDERRELLPGLLAAGAAGARVLVMEPLSRRSSPWWPAWAQAFAGAGGRADEWRLRIVPPPVTVALGRAAGLDPVEATGRTLWI